MDRWLAAGWVDTFRAFEPRPGSLLLVEPAFRRPPEKRRLAHRLRARVPKTFRELIRDGQMRDIDPRIATFALLGMINWTYQWFGIGGRIRDTELAEAYIDLFLGGLLKSHDGGES